MPQRIPGSDGTEGRQNPLFEIKTATGKQSQWQIEFQETCEAHGGTYILARSVKDVQPWLTRVRPLF